MRFIIGFFSSMTASDLIPFIFLNYLTAIMVFYVAAKLFDIKFSWGNLLFSSFLYAIAMLLIRKIYIYMQIPLGTHTLYLVLIKALLIYFLLKARIIEAVIGSIITTLLILAATPIAFKIISLLNIDYQALTKNVILFTLVGHVEGIYLILAVIVLAVSDFNVYKLLK